MAKKTFIEDEPTPNIVLHSHTRERVRKLREVYIPQYKAEAENKITTPERRAVATKKLAELRTELENIYTIPDPKLDPKNVIIGA